MKKNTLTQSLLQFLTGFLFLFSLMTSQNVNAQNIDEATFLNGTYDKAQIRQHRIEKMSVTSVVNTHIATQSEYLFDKNGLLLKVTNSGDTLSNYAFWYNKEGDLIRRSETPAGKKEVIWINYKRYYSNGKLIRSISSEDSLTTVYRYNADGLLKEKTTYLTVDTAKAEKKKVVYYSYDAYKRLILNERYQISNEGKFPYDVGQNSYSYIGNTNKVFSYQMGEDAVFYFSYYENDLLKSLNGKIGEDPFLLDIEMEYKYIFYP